MSTITAQIQLRRDTVANWTSNNPILLAGEMALSTDLLYTGTDQPRYKIGNGIDTWLNLDYVPEGGLGSFVPYTGATQDVDLDTFGLNAKFLSVKGNSGAGHLGLKHQSVDATAGGQETVLFAGSDGELYYKNDGGSVVQIASESWVTSQLIANYTQSFYFPTFSPADATNYYVGNCNNTPFTTDTNVRLMALKTGSLKKVAFNSRQTAGSSENSTFALGINGSYTNIATTVKFDGVPNNNNLITGLNIAVTEGDVITLRWTTPTWVTNPTGVAAIITLYFE